MEGEGREGDGDGRGGAGGGPASRDPAGGVARGVAGRAPAVKGWRAVAGALEGRPGGWARGEFWLGRDLLRGLGLQDSPAGLAQAWLDAGMDLGCLPVAEEPEQPPVYFYRRFTPAELRSGLGRGRAPAGMEDLFLFVALDGPWGRWSARLGLLEALEGLGASPEEAARELAGEAERARVLLHKARQALPGLRGVLWCDDLAYQRAPFMSPQAFSRLLLPLYRGLVQECRRLGLAPVLHSDGNLIPLVAALRQAAFAGLVCDCECMEPRALRAQAPEWTLFTGIPSSWLLSGACGPPGATPERVGSTPGAGGLAQGATGSRAGSICAVVGGFAALTAVGRAVLSSVSGLPDVAAWGRLQGIYSLLTGLS